MARVGRFECSKCDRVFTMKAHLARHNNAIHGSGAGGRRMKKKRRRGYSRGRRRAAASPASNGAADLVSRLEAYHAELKSRLTVMEDQIEAAAGAIRALGVAAPVSARRRRGRPRGRRNRAGSLGEYVLRALRRNARPMGPKAIAAAVRKAGYKTHSRDLTRVVSNTLPRLSEVKKAGFGFYRV